MYNELPKVVIYFLLGFLHIEWYNEYHNPMSEKNC